MKVKRILLTGDDGYNSLGTRILIHYLKKDYDIVIAATKSQQSGVGGRLSMKNGGKWGEAVVDGVRALWVDGSPVDAVECAESYFPKPFDLIISGINLGANVSGAIISSGTFAAAFRGIHLGLADKAIVVSWKSVPGSWIRDHNGSESIVQELEYPGTAANKIIRESLKSHLWGAGVLNINFPEKPTHKAAFTKFYPDITGYYKYPMIMDRKSRNYRYSLDYNPHKVKNLEYDIGALHRGFISITPCQNDFLSTSIYKKLKNKHLELK